MLRLRLRLRLLALLALLLRPLLPRPLLLLLRPLLLLVVSNARLAFALPPFLQLVLAERQGGSCGRGENEKWGGVGVDGYSSART